MSEEIKQKLSAYLDDELEIEHLSGLHRDIVNKPEFRAKLNRYALISETLKGNRSNCDAADIINSVQQALEKEPTVFAPSAVKKPSGPTWKTYVGGAAIAATVAAVAVLNISSLNQSDSDLNEFPVTVDVQNFTPKPFNAGLSQKASTKWSTANTSSPELEDELNQLLIEHSEYTTQTGIPGLLPYATFVVYDKQ